ncbi:hypothetical protein C8R44DRAFT_910079 [Mycena epipterygia]|nr:hypothetical protein C8R44DRAFT_910079 [Mycena epipterygia]
MVCVHGEVAYAIAAGDACVVRGSPYGRMPYVRVSGAQVVRVSVPRVAVEVFVRRGDSHARMVPPRALRDVRCEEGRTFTRGESRVLIPSLGWCTERTREAVVRMDGVHESTCGAGRDSRRGDDVRMHGEVAASLAGHRTGRPTMCCVSCSARGGVRRGSDALGVLRRGDARRAAGMRTRYGVCIRRAVNTQSQGVCGIVRMRESLRTSVVVSLPTCPGCVRDAEPSAFLRWCARSGVVCSLVRHHGGAEVRAAVRGILRHGRMPVDSCGRGGQLYRATIDFTPKAEIGDESSIILLPLQYISSNFDFYIASRCAGLWGAQAAATTSRYNCPSWRFCAGWNPQALRGCVVLTHLGAPTITYLLNRQALLALGGSTAHGGSREHATGEDGDGAGPWSTP